MKSDSFLIIHKLLNLHSLSSLLSASRLSRSGYYKWKKSYLEPHKSFNSDLKKHIAAIHSVRPYYGYRRLTVALNKEGFPVNHKRVYRLMKELGIQSAIRKKRKYFGKSGSIVYSNILKRNFNSDKPLEKLVTDITYLPVKTGFIYLSALQDLYNNEIVSYFISKRNDLNLVLKTVKKLSNTNSTKSIIHSDQGFQYTSKQYQREITRLGFKGSHSRKGNCLDNACIESFFSHLKTEGFPRKVLLKEEEAITCIKKYIEFYNNQRFQKKLGQLSPIEYREKLAA